MDDDGPLAGTLVLDFSQFLAGPVAALRLADLGARVIKIERPVTGEIGRTLAFGGLWCDGDTLSFHAMNRNKESVAADLKNPEDLRRVKRLVARADVLIQNFRPGVMERIGLDPAAVARLNPGLVYASASGYGAEGPWAGRPGQDLLAQSVSGLPWVGSVGSVGRDRPDAPVGSGRSGAPVGSGGSEGPERSAGERPIPVGLAIADHVMSCNLAGGVTALLVRRARTGRGGLVETSLLEAMLDLQFERLTARLNPEAEASGPSPLVSGLYATKDGYLALGPTTPDRLQTATGTGVATDLTQAFRGRSTQTWLDVLTEENVPCAPVLTLEELLESEAFGALDMIGTLERAPREPGGAPVRIRTTRSPIRIDGRRPAAGSAAPRLPS